MIRNSFPLVYWARRGRSPLNAHVTRCPLASTMMFEQGTTLERSSSRLCTCHVQPLSITTRNQRVTAWLVDQKLAVGTSERAGRACDSFDFALHLPSFRA